MSDEKRKRFESAVANLELRYGPRVVVRARDAAKLPQAIPTGFTTLDEMLGIGGVPCNAITLLSGHSTSGKLTLAYKVLSHAQWPSPSSQRQRLHPVAIIDTNASSDPDYLMRCGVDLNHLLIVRPQTSRQAIEVLLDLIRNRSLRAVLVDNLTDLTSEPDSARYFDSVLPQLNQLLNSARCALICLNELQPLWRRWLHRLSTNAIQQHASLHIELKHERWLERSNELYGYQAQARVKRNKWAREGQTASIAIEFNGTVRARRTW